MDQNFPRIDEDAGSHPIIEEKKHSGFGVASFVISILVPSFFACLSLTVGRTPGNILYTGMAIASYALLFIGLGLGIAGLFHENKKRLFALLGLIFSFLWILASIILYALGSVAL